MVQIFDGRNLSIEWSYKFLMSVEPFVFQWKLEEAWDIDLFVNLWENLYRPKLLLYMPKPLLVGENTLDNVG